jgi:hypothetical protein
MLHRPPDPRTQKRFTQFQISRVVLDIELAQQLLGHAKDCRSFVCTRCHGEYRTYQQNM